MHQLAIEEAEQGIKVARNAYLPSLSLKAEASYIGDGYMTDRDFSNGIHAEMPHFGNSFVVKAQQVIYAGGGIKSSIEQNKLQKQVSEQTYLDNRQNLRFLLAGYYLDLFQLRNQELVYQKNIEQTRLLVKDMQAAYRQGTALKSDITRYELQLQNLELKQTSTTNKLNVLNHELVTTLGLEEGIRLHATHISDWANWRYMHWFVIGMLLIVWACVWIFTRPFRARKKMPLYGIDWMGGLLWGIILFAIVFICIYGEFYDWTDSMEIRASIVIAVVALLININRMLTLKRPYIELEVFTYRNFPVILFLFLMLCFFLTTSSVLQNQFMTAILHYDSLNAISLNWCVFVGILAGAAVVFYRQVILRKGFKLLISVGFLFIMIYEYYMYFLIHPNLNIESLYLPNFLKGIGHGILYISLTIYVAKSVPFKHFFQGLCVLSFIRTSIATPLGTAILSRWMRHLQQENIGLLSRRIDGIRDWMPQISIKDLYITVFQQTMLTSLKELFGIVCIFGTLFLICDQSERTIRHCLYFRNSIPDLHIYISCLEKTSSP